MDTESLAALLREEVRKDEEKPALELWEALIARGAIDRKGRVLLRAPAPMMAPRRKKKKAR